ncbi:hypothetical protein MN608_09944 [Microdochium nivale]|nr:hypothetical protein MN608_09944 [Microdochium nivale]
MAWVPVKRNSIGFDTYLDALISIGDDATKMAKDTCMIDISARITPKSMTNKFRPRRE